MFRTSPSEMSPSVQRRLRRAATCLRDLTPHRWCEQSHWPGRSPQTRVIQRERLGGVPITRVFVIPYHGQSVLGRMANYASFMLAATVAAPFVPRPDVIYAWHPPLTIGVVAAALGAMFRVPIVYDVQDIWPDE